MENICFATAFKITCFCRENIMIICKAHFSMWMQTQWAAHESSPYKKPYETLTSNDTIMNRKKPFA